VSKERELGLERIHLCFVEMLLEIKLFIIQQKMFSWMM